MFGSGIKFFENRSFNVDRGFEEIRENISSVVRDDDWAFKFIFNSIYFFLDNI
jgi:hypothetical protein